MARGPIDSCGWRQGGLQKGCSLRVTGAYFLLVEGRTRGHYCGEGHTINISVRGAFVLAVACPPVGADVDLIILLPARSEMPWTFRIRAKARVLRVEQADPSEERKRFAVSFRRAKWE